MNDGDEKERVVITGPKLPAAVRVGEAGGPLADWQVRRRMALPEGDPRRLVIRPYDAGTSERGRVSSGQSSYGYDLRLGRDYLIFANTGGFVIDVRDFKRDALIPWNGDFCLIPPNAYVLAETVEYLEIPEDVIGIVTGKSSYARVGVGVNMTAVEPGWRGVLTVEIANHTPLPIKIWSGDGIGQLIFLRGSAPCEVPYGKKDNPRYQDQRGLTTPIV